MSAAEIGLAEACELYHKQRMAVGLYYCNKNRHKKDVAKAWELQQYLSVKSPSC